VHGRDSYLNLPGRSRVASAQDEHNDDDEKDEADEAPADVDPGCKQHAFVIPIVWRSQTAAGFHPTSGGVLIGHLDRKQVSPMDSNLDQAKGRAKQAAGDLTDNKDLKKEGKADENAGKAKEFVDGVKDKADDLIDTVRDKVTKD
jgi:uncharacterized protein YjbJ (UPF0337 family)